MQQSKEQTMGKKSGFVIEGCLPSDVDVPLRIYSAAIKRKNVYTFAALLVIDYTLSRQRC